MADQELKIWAEALKTDGVTGIEQRQDLTDEEFLDGWLRLSTVDAQQINQLFYLLTLYSNSISNTPTLFPTSVSIPSSVLEMNGQPITEQEYPNAYSIYGANLPNISGSAPSGFTYVVRAH